MSSPHKKTKLKKSEVQKYVNLDTLFPKKRPDFRSELSPYQVRKINKAIATVKQLGGVYEKQIVHMGRGRKKYLAEKGLPEYMNGIFLAGGDKVNSRVEYVGGVLRYMRGDAMRGRIDLDCETEETTEASARNALYARPEGYSAALTANGRVIAGEINMDDDELVVTSALYVFNKYADMAANGEIRYINSGGQKKAVYAAHPSQWGIGILFEQKESRARKTKKTSKKK